MLQQNSTCKRPSNVKTYFSFSFFYPKYWKANARDLTWRVRQHRPLAWRVDMNPTRFLTCTNWREELKRLNLTCA